MVTQSFVTRAAAGTRPSAAGAGVLLVVALAVGRLVAGRAGELAWRFGQLQFGTATYRAAQWSSTAALASLVAAAGSLVVWLVARSLRSALGVPQRSVDRISGWRIAATSIALMCLLFWASDEVMVRRWESGPWVTVVVGLAVCANFTWGVPRLVRDALAALASRLPLVALPLSSLARLPASGRVRVRGVVRAGAEAMPVAAGNAVCRRAIGDDEPLEVVPFFLDDDTGRAQVELVGRPVIAELRDHPLPEGVLPAWRALVDGDRVEVVAEVEGATSDGAYRSGPRVLTSRTKPAYLFGQAGGRAMSKRLTFAAAVELASAGGLALSSLALLATWLWLRHAAHLEIPLIKAG